MKMRSLPIWIFLGVLSIYLLTLNPTVSGGDSGELITVAYRLGIAHPPGYPLYTILSKLFTFIPFGSVAWRVNLFSAVCDALAATVLFQVVYILTQSKTAGVFTAGFFGFSPLIWNYAVVAEVFALNNLIVALLIWTAILAFKTKTQTYLCRFAFLCGLGMANQYLIVFVILPLTLWLIIENQKDGNDLLNLRRSIVYGMWILVGLTPYFYLPLAASFSDSISLWGNASTLEGFLIHISRREYGVFQLIMGTSGERSHLWEQLGSYGRIEFKDSFGICGFFACLGGAKALFKNLKSTSIKISVAESHSLLVIFTGISFLSYLITFCFLANPLSDPIFNETIYPTVLSRFWQQPHLIVCIWAGLGFHYLNSKLNLNRWGRSLSATALIMFQIGGHYKAADQSENWTFKKFAEAVIGPLPDKSLLIASGDAVINSIRYLQQVEGYRKDVPVLDLDSLSVHWYNRLISQRIPEVVLPASGVYKLSDGYQLNDFLNLNFGRFQIFGCNGIRKPWDQSTQSHYLIWPMGLLEMVLPFDRELPLPDWVVGAKRFSSFDPMATRQFPKESWEYSIFDLYWATKAYQITYMINHIILSKTIHVNTEVIEFLNREIAKIVQSKWPDEVELSKLARLSSYINGL